MSRLFSVAIGVFLVVSTAFPQGGAPKEGKKEELVRKLSGNIENLEQFGQIAAEARAAGFSEQSILEAKLLYCIKRNDTGSMSELLPQLDASLAGWKEQNSALFRERAELESLIHLAKSAVANKAGDEAAFECEMKEAFWANPSLASILAERIIAFRNRKALRELVLPMDLTMEKSSGGTTTLRELAKGQKALLLDFWASWCLPCMSSMGELQKRTEKLGPQGIRVVGMNTETDRAKAEKAWTGKKMSAPCLIEPKERPLTMMLKVDAIPRMALITPDGKIEFNGHPEDSELESVLDRVLSQGNK